MVLSLSMQRGLRETGMRFVLIDQEIAAFALTSLALKESGESCTRESKPIQEGMRKN